ncbi:DEAD/DEAH box helicase [Shewanella fidelis]|uniref:DEAD-box ATP-dependent RNA helicase RhpA n=1 Tax=Shewanella fidelis TaxID=173509 RepID=A0AAW8NMC2_9GAMM|nr:DEAD/DEAH box helicase [Shewanella fidelis]MDR8522934.1 DEAD/DEAH box helicase [Shewanella fidelis]MDW4811740.1 DEAD/DEAH box helicase [Shewanella fidelis]MDW4815861.1 DEAD/DEAH box helicase [Shewanella fidelis]MDW4819951.1 DEAD/DEAH box helicase [Shewanella fidelis]MDW4824075.1 DEAD/DEAH box helicase [Shewanella fidelis]
MSFSSLALSDKLLSVLAEKGYQQPTAIQAEAIPAILVGNDLMASAQTGTGKTAAFTLPLLQLLLEKADRESNSRRASVLVLTPTRELAVQVNTNISQYAVNTDINSLVIYGGVSIDAQANKLAAGVDVIVATPGRLLDHVRRGSLELTTIEHLVFDEADRMLDMGFMDEISAILKQLPAKRQTLLFSATFSSAIYDLSKKLLQKPIRIEVDKANSAAHNVEQIVYAVDSERKTALISHLITKHDWHQVLIFSRKKQTADQICQQMIAAGIETKAFHGDLGQGAREQVLNDFKQGKIKALVATDVAARGLDIVELKVVVNYEIPFVAEDYVHRIGRTGRAGNTGKAITLYSEDDALLLEEVEIVLDKRLPQQWLPGFEPDLTKMEQPSRKNSKAAQRQRAKKRALGGKKRR